MPWNWELPEWPNFRFDASALAGREKQFLLACGSLLGSAMHLGPDDHDQIRIQLLSEEALRTSRIEGELLDRDSVQSSLQRQFGIKGDRRRIAPAEKGISELLVDLYTKADEALTEARLLNWHRTLLQGMVGIRPGSYRSGDEPMRIVSGPVHDPVVHFEAPPARRVSGEMKRFFAWWKRSQEMPALARAAVAHLHFESIHPFEDGNGRLGRAIAELALSQAAGEPIVLALSQVIEQGRKRYYTELHAASTTLEIDRWLAYFSEIVMDAQDLTKRSVDFLIAKTKFFDRYREQLNARQEKALRRIFQEGLEGFEGGLSAANYRAITKTSTASASRDLANLVSLGALRKTGDLKSARYHLPFD